ncbi:MAG: pyridine nucleotide-disulfide oxidoreductase, partial [Candidatus Altiarchaeales archaeon]
MKTINADIAIIGGGPAGLAAAIQANKSGISHDRILIIERNEFLGGILQQCIHDGFGILLFNKLLTGPEYAQIFVDDVRKREIKYMLGSTVTSIKKVNGGFSLEVCSKKFGIMNIMSKSIIFSTGCRERTRGQILIPGTRPAGIYTAGCVQNLVNLKGILPGK